MQPLHKGKRLHLFWLRRRNGTEYCRENNRPGNCVAVLLRRIAGCPGYPHNKPILIPGRISQFENPLRFGNGTPGALFASVLSFRMLTRFIAGHSPFFCLYFTIMAKVAASTA